MCYDEIREQVCGDLLSLNQSSPKEQINKFERFFFFFLEKLIGKKEEPIQNT